MRRPVSPPAPSIADHRIEDSQEFSHARGQRDLGWLPRISKPSVERPDNGIEAASGERCHIEHGSQVGAATHDVSIASPVAAVVIHRGDANETRDLPSSQVSDFPESPSDKGLSGRDDGDSRRCLKPDLEAPCGPRPPGGGIAARAFATKPT